MTFQERDAVLRGKALRAGLKLRKRPNFLTWNLYTSQPNRDPCGEHLVRIAWGSYDEMLSFFRGLEYGGFNRPR